MQLARGRKALGNSSLGALGARKPLLVALVLGLLAAVLTWNYVQRAGQGAKHGALVPVVVAAQDIPVRTEVTAQMLAIKEVPVEARHEKAFTSLEQVNGKVTSLPISAGEQVLNTKFFARKEDSGLAFQVPPGHRAISVSVSEVVTSGGLIVPGDYVDVIALFAGDTAGRDTAATVLQNIQVLAIAQSLQGAAPEAQGSPSLLPANKPDTTRQEAVARPNARTATLDVTPEDAEKLILAEQRGQIRLSLRGVQDRQAVGVSPITLDDIKR
jgi:pilus assembly protein CpaB